MATHKVQVTITGTRPILMSQYPIEGIKTHSRGQREPQTPAEKSAEKSAYRDSDGGLFIPSTHIHFALREGCKRGQFKVGRQVAHPIIMAAVEVNPARVSLGKSEYEVDSQPVVNKSSGARITAHRARIDLPWELSFQLVIDDDVLEPEVVRRSLVHAGLVDGVGTYRSRYGKFKVAEWVTET